jgi:hypothetical protein
MDTDVIPSWLVYALAVFTVMSAATAGSLFIMHGFSSQVEPTTDGYSMTENADEGVVEIEVDEVTVVRETIMDTGLPLIGKVVTNTEEVKYDRLNVTTDEGGGTGEFLDGYEPGDTVTLEAVEEPEWQEEDTGEYAADGDEVYLATPRSDSGRYIIEALGKTEPVNLNRSERGFPE